MFHYEDNRHSSAFCYFVEYNIHKKEDALDAMIDALVSGGHITKADEARKAVFDREKSCPLESAKVLLYHMVKQIISPRQSELS